MHVVLRGELCRIQLIRLLGTFCVPSHVVIPLCVILFKSQNNLEGFLFVWVLWGFFWWGGLARALNMRSALNKLLTIQYIVLLMIGTVLYRRFEESYY